MSATSKWDGVAELGKALEDLTKATGRNVARRALTTALEPVAETARELVREDTGTLKESIKVGTKLGRNARRNHQRRAGAVHVFVGPGPLMQAGTEEFGTSDQAPHPFMRPAVEEHRDAIPQAVADELGKEVKKAADRAARRAARAAAKARQG